MNSISRYASLLLLVIVFSSCATSVSEPAAPSAVMLGDWSYSSPHVVRSGPDLNAGVRVQIGIDSLADKRFWGQVTLWFAGDVGISPAAFGRVSGSVDDGNGVTLVIPRANEPSLMVLGDVATDVLTVRECHAGTEPGPFAAGAAFVRLKTLQD
jgi:hypothetical protein